MTTTVFLRVLEADDKAAALLAALRVPVAGMAGGRFELDPLSFGSVPRSPFAYWVGRQVQALFGQLPQFESETRTAKQGLATTDDFRFLRAWWAVASRAVRYRWFPFAKGGASARFYADLHLLVNWQHGIEDGRELKAHIETTPGTTHWSRRAASADLYFRPGLTWPLRASRFAPQALPSGAIFSVRGYSAFVTDDDLPLTLGIFSSGIFDYLFKTTLGRFGFPEFIVGVLQALPWPTPVPIEARTSLATLAVRAWSIGRANDTANENSHAFNVPSLLRTANKTISERTCCWVEHVIACEAELLKIQSEIDSICYCLYGISDEDRRAIERNIVTTTGESDDDTIDAVDDEQAVGAGSPAHDANLLTAQFVSWAHGVAIGRFDLRLATGERQLPPDPAPFDALPLCSPGMLTGDDGLPVDAPPANYPVAFPIDGILVDDPGHDRDLLARIRQVFSLIFGDAGDARLAEATSILDPRADDLRPWLRRSFFEQHILRYSKSRRIAPIYWRLGTTSGSYSVWIYLHRFNKDTLHRVLNDHVAPKLRYEQSRLDALRSDAGPSPAPSQRKALDELETLGDELQALRDEVARLTPLWDPDLDDGVILNAAPLHRLFAHTRSWQRECETAWKKLCAGEYDWAHLSMRLWPERVVPKCAEDRSLAIAHGLEDAFWLEGTDGKWRPKGVGEAEIAELVRVRTSAAVKDALVQFGQTQEPAPARKARAGKAAGEPKAAKAARAPANVQFGLGLPGDPTAAELNAVRAALHGAAEGLPKAELLVASGLGEDAGLVALAVLVQSGEVEKIGAGRGTRYRLGGGA